MDYKNILLILAAGADFGLSFYIYLLNRKNKINIYFALVLLSVGLWALEIALFRMVTNTYYLWLWLNSFYLTAALIGCFFFLFARSFPYEIRKAGKVENLLLLASTLYIIGLIVFGGGMVHNIYYSSDRAHSVDINLYNYLAYSIYFIMTVGLGFYALFRKLRAATAIYRNIIVRVLIAVSLAAIFGITFDLVLPVFTYAYIWIGPVFTLGMVLVIVRYVFIRKPV